MAQYFLPTGFNRADGKTPLPSNPPSGFGASATVGTPTPDGSLIIQSSAGDGVYEIEEDVDSPEIERAEQGTVMHSLTMGWIAATNFLATFGRGSFQQDSFGNIWRVLSNKIKSLRGDRASLQYTAESISFDSPPDEFQITPSDLGIDIIKYPRYFFALYPSGDDYTTTVGTGSNIATVAQVKQAIIRGIQTYRDSPYFPAQGTLTVNGVVQNNIVSNFIAGLVPTPVSNTGTGSEVSIDVSGNASCLLAIAAANEIIQKLWFQLDTPYIAGWDIVFTQYFFQPVYMNPGGYIEDPSFIVPDYFLQPAPQNSLARGDLTSPWGNQDTLPPVNGAHGVGGPTIFDQMALLNPQCYSSTGTSSGATNISWLRKADEVVFERTWFRRTMRWSGSPIGHWDQNIFQQGPRPSVPSDYLPLV